MIKEEKIKEALGLSEPWSLDSVIDKLAEASDILLHRYNYDGIHWEEISHCVEKSKHYRKRLEEIQVSITESNNGWIKIESEADLPKEGKIFWVMKIGYSYPIVERLYNDDANYWLNQFTHYQPIRKPELPIY